MSDSQTKTPESYNETLDFSADVSRLLDIVAHALYSNRDVFLRELISNAADACDRLRYEALTKPELIQGQYIKADDEDFKIHVRKDTTDRTVTVLDTGIGMSREELAENLGTIAKSGTRALMEQAKKTPPLTPPQAGGKKTAMQASGGENMPLNLIGQFGVGFYASFMVADRVTVISRKASSDETWVWQSDGRTGFTLHPADEAQIAQIKAGRGTAIILHIKDEASDFLLDQKLEEVIKTYSDHISFPIYLGDFPEPTNKASALWMRPKSEITEEQYKEFYHHIGPGMDAPMQTYHWKAEGVIEYTALLFTPTLRPWDLYDPTRKHAVRLYVKRVFITDECEGLMYPWLRFLRGVIDSEDLPLNISREMLQHNPVINKIRSGVAKKVLRDLDKMAQDSPVDFATFWGQFGAVLKEGLYDAVEHREALLKVARFHSTYAPSPNPLPEGERALSSLTSLLDYVNRMRGGQKAIYYISGENLENLKNSPQLEGFKKRGLEVLFFTDTIDSFWLQSVMDFDGKPFKSITQGDIDLSAFNDKDDDGKDDKSEDSAAPDAILAFCAKAQELLDDEVSAVRVSKRLTDSPVCLVAADSGVDMHMERVLKIQQQYQSDNKRVLEINAQHPLIKKIAALPNGSAHWEDAAHLLLDQAKIIQGEPVNDPARFARAMAQFMERAL